MSQIRANYDEPWKEALTEYFEQFLFFFFPSIHQLINWEKIPESLDKELQRVTASSKTAMQINYTRFGWLVEKKCGC
ncbi:hypothetical protein U9R62_01475 [Cylindrospermopsis raciborskii DSH]|uniref:hypothetical protein n=1 Tax=Cylindrospermopsis raciborskii TaxID=77022 RepID=UPI002ED9E3BD